MNTAPLVAHGTSILASMVHAHALHADHRESPLPGEHPIPGEPSPGTPPTPSDPPVVPPSPVA